MNKKQKKFLISGLVIAAAIVLIVSAGFKGNQVFYVTVEELHAKAPEFYGERLRMAGNVKEGTIEKDSTQLFTRFEMIQDSQHVTVEYKGITPDMFKEKAEVIVEGTYTEAGVFRADNLMAKCASRYEGDIQDMEAMEKARGDSET